MTTLDDPRVRADWNLVSGVYNQLSQILRDSQADYVPPAIPGFLAEALSRAAAFYSGDELKMADDLLAVMSESESLSGGARKEFRSLYFDERVERFDYYSSAAVRRRRPTPFETSVETCRRLRDLQAIRKSLASTDTGIVLGGSMSYGKFLNVTGAESPKGSSDTDLLISLEGNAQLDQIASALSRVPGISPADMEIMGSRILRYAQIAANLNLPCSFSQKLGFWTEQQDPWLEQQGIKSEYKLSIHCFPSDAFDYLLLADMTVLDRSDGSASSRLLNDYRQDIPNLRSDHQRSLTGKNLFLERPFQEVAEGYVTDSRAFVIDNEDRYYPGMFQNLVLPQFEVALESPDCPITNRLSLFRWKIVERLRKERQMRPYELFRLSMSHTRSSVFAPHIIRQVDNI